MIEFYGIDSLPEWFLTFGIIFLFEESLFRAIIK